MSRAGEPQSPQRVRHGVRKESKNAASDSFWTLFGLRGALFGDSGAPRRGTPFRTLLGFRARRARETSVPGRRVPNSSDVCFVASPFPELRSNTAHLDPRFLSATLTGWPTNRTETGIRKRQNRMADCVNSSDWAATNGGVTNGGLRGVWPPFLEIGRNRPFSTFFCLIRPFLEGAKSTWKIQKTEEKGLFPQISSDLLKPPSLKPPFAAFQSDFREISGIRWNLGEFGEIREISGKFRGIQWNSVGFCMALSMNSVGRSQKF